MFVKVVDFDVAVDVAVTAVFDVACVAMATRSALQGGSEGKKWTGRSVESLGSLRGRLEGGLWLDGGGLRVDEVWE